MLQNMRQPLIREPDLLPKTIGQCFHAFLNYSLRPSPPELSCPGAVRPAKGFEGLEDFQNVRWLGAGELFGEVGGRDGRGGGV